MLVAGHGTTLNLVTNAVRALLTHPGQLALVLSGEHPWTSVTEEALRRDSPVGHFPMRYATEDIPLGGEVIRRGDAVLASYAAAGRDPHRLRGDGRRLRPDPRAGAPSDLRPRRALLRGRGPGPPGGGGGPPGPLRPLPAPVPGRPLRLPHPSPSFISNSVRTLPVLLDP
ncbi:hypothetical protein GCM10020221_15400 [Streptomyces thioluteus]|uniref:Uncharacterized protein n=1 Tax=Streptomyces thioluteus TaxID=66431 RepID=A0ABP6J3Z5_STRTU